MNTNIRHQLADHASEEDHRQIPLNRVGIQGLNYPIRVMERSGKTQSTIATVGVYVSLPAHQRGTHMSRLVDVIHANRDDMTIRRLPQVLRELRNRLDAPAVELELEFTYFIDKAAPVSQVRSLMDYTVGFCARLDGAQFDFDLRVQIPVKSLCPCSKSISDRGAHNQRSQVSVEIRGNEFIWIEDVVEKIESISSAPLYALLKREDEKYITELAYDHPKFAEDLARDSLQELRTFEGVHTISVTVENQESIHNHQAYAAASWTRNQQFEHDTKTEIPSMGSPHTQKVTFGTWLRSIRASRKLSQSELAKNLGITASFVSRIESDVRAPSLEMLARLSIILGLTQDEVFLRAGHLPPNFRDWAMMDPQAVLARLEMQTRTHEQNKKRSNSSKLD